MTRLAGDYAPLAAGLLVLCLVLLFMMRGERAWTDDCADPEALRAWKFGGVVDPRDDATELGGPLIQWTRGPLEPHLEGAQSLRFAVIRSFDPISLYARPARLRKDFEPDRARREYVQAGDDVLPIQFLYSATTQRIRLLAYVLAYRDQPVESPFWSQVRAALPEAIYGKKPMTALMIGTVSRRRDLAATEEAARAWLAQAWQDYRALCSP